MARKYEQRRRAEAVAETRQRIVEAAVALHTTLGPAATSLSAVAERAGVQRHTLYAHFPDPPSLFRACSAHWEAAHPQPDLREQLALADPAERLRAVLRLLYGWYAGVEDDLALFARDRHVYPPFAAEEEARLRALRDEVARGRPRRALPAVGHALEFETWRSLERRQGLGRARAVELMVELADRAGA